MSEGGRFSRPQGYYPPGAWKILIVDDDPGMHMITRTVLRDLQFENQGIEFLSAYSRAEAQALLHSESGIALALLDVVMEEGDAGLQLVSFIREELGNPHMRIVLRTGQPGRAPSRRVIVDYDINDYEEKTELTAQRLHTLVMTALRNYRDLMALEVQQERLKRHRDGLEGISRLSADLYWARSVSELAIEVYGALRRLLGAPRNAYCAVQDHRGFRTIAADGDFVLPGGGAPPEVLGNDVFDELKSLKRRGRSLLIRNNSVFLYEDARRIRMLVCIRSDKRLEAQDRQLLEVFAGNVAVAFENLRLNQEIEGTQEELVVRLGEVVETRTRDTAQHVRRVGELCGLLAMKVGFDESSANALRMASALHDIGKIGIPDEILLKPESLNDEERHVMQSHTEIGYRLLRGSSRPLLQEAAMICLQHHENYDGSGYPNGLSGEAISLQARIVALCDSFDSLTHGRQHRAAWSFSAAITYIEEEKGRRFDPELVELFLQQKDALAHLQRQFPDH
ncbi:MAG: DUF3369 domain-containing protein [Spirochaetales bacterium]|nr:DUF3369 domain-containing protein [Spirochaetales bacterium]